MSRLCPFLRLVAALACGLLVATAGAAHRAPPSAETVRAAAFLAVAGDFAGLCGSVPVSRAACDLCCTASGIAPTPVRAAPPAPLAFANPLGSAAPRLVLPARDWSRSVRAPPFARHV